MDDESAFRRKVAAVLRDLARQVDAIDTDALDWRIADGVLHVEVEGGGVVVLSQQVPTREIWLSAAPGLALPRASGRRPGGRRVGGARHGRGARRGAVGDLLAGDGGGGADRGRHALTPAVDVP